QDPKQPPKAKELDALLQARLVAARKAYEEAVAASQQTKREGQVILLLVRPHEVCVCSVNLLKAELGTCTKNEDRIAALRSHLGRMADLEKRTNELQKKGLIPPVETRIVEFHRAEAEVWLAQEGKEQPKPKCGPATQE